MMMMGVVVVFKPGLLGLRILAQRDVYLLNKVTLKAAVSVSVHRPTKFL